VAAGAVVLAASGVVSLEFVVAEVLVLAGLLERIKEHPP
jgi:hypothetical protein